MALAVALLTGVAGCSPDASANELQTVTLTSEQDEYPAALLEGTLGSVTEGDKVYFYITDEFDATWGLVLPAGYAASQDGQTIRLKGQERANVGDRVDSGGGVIKDASGGPADSDTADLWDAKHEVDGLWLSSGVEKN